MKHKVPSTASSSSRDARLVKTDSALRRSLLSLLERKPLEQITIRDITAEADVHYTTFFRHHAGKEALFDHVAADEIARLIELVVPLQDSINTHAAFVALGTYVDEKRPLWTALLTGGAAATMRAELMRVSANLVRHRVRKVDWIPAELSVTCSVTVIIETLAWWLGQPTGAVSVEEVAKMLDWLTFATAMSSPSDIPALPQARQTKA